VIELMVATGESSLSSTPIAREVLIARSRRRLTVRDISPLFAARAQTPAAKVKKLKTGSQRTANVRKRSNTCASVVSSAIQRSGGCHGAMLQFDSSGYDRRRHMGDSKTGG
jgi:hypothetical protein